MIAPGRWYQPPSREPPPAPPPEPRPYRPTYHKRNGGPGRRRRSWGAPFYFTLLGCCAIVAIGLLAVQAAQPPASVGYFLRDFVLAVGSGMIIATFIREAIDQA